MACNNNCNKRATVVIATLLVLCIFSMGFGIWKLIHENTGLDCAVEVQFNDSKATYIGKTV